MLAAAVLLALSPAAAEPAQHLSVVDIRHATGADVAAMKHGAGVRWWLELGDRLVLAGAAEPMRTLRESHSVLGEVDDVTTGQLVLRGRGCKDRADPPGTMLARGGRWELRRLAAGESMPAGEDADDAWRHVVPNTVMAHQTRLDNLAAAPSDPRVQPLVDAIDTVRWFGDVTTLAGYDRSSYGTTSLNAARDWIAGQFSALGLTATTPSFSMPGTGGSGSITRNNVLGVWTGTTYPNEWVVVGAHYDSRNQSLSSTTNTPGAEDNATGCAGVIELARAVVPHHPQRTILFMCYAGEEQGLYGSAAHATALQNSGDLSKVSAVLIMDMIGYSHDDSLDAQFESYATWQVYMDKYAAAAATYVPALNVTISTNPFGSDHMPYLQKSKQTLLAIETDYDLYPYYHRSTDTPTNIGPRAQAMGGAILKTDVAVLADLAGAYADVDDLIFANDFE